MPERKKSSNLGIKMPQTLEQKSEESKSNLLVVEDNSTFYMAAYNFFSSLRDLQVTYAKDYDTVMNELQKRSYNAAIIDCFFPKKTGSGDVTSGFHAIRKMLEAEANGQRILEYEQELGKYVNMDFELKKYARMLGTFSLEKPEDNHLIRIATRLTGISRDLATTTAKEALSLVLKSWENEFKDYYGALYYALSKSSSNCPLGILVAEEAERLKVPFTLAISVEEGLPIQPVQNYSQKKAWNLVVSPPDKPDEKATEGFWQRAYNALLNHNPL